jgi:hypothetical protein
MVLPNHCHDIAMYAYTTFLHTVAVVYLISLNKLSEPVCVSGVCVCVRASLRNPLDILLCLEHTAK